MRSPRRSTALLLVVVLALAADSLASLTDSAVYAPPGFYTFTPPAVGKSYVDPVFGETVTRVTDVLNVGYPGPIESLAAEYASSALTNADDTYVRLWGGSGSRLFSLPSLSYIGNLPMSSSSPSDFWWHVSDPNLLYAVPSNRLEVYNVATNQKTVVYTFSQFGKIVGMGESNLSHDGNRLALRGKNPVGGGSDQLLVYEFSTNSIVASIPVSAIPDFFDATIAPSGQRVIAHVIPKGMGGQVQVFDVNVGAGTLTKTYELPRGAGHNDAAFAPDGKEYLVMVDSWFTNTLYRYDLQDGTRTTLIPFGWGASPIALHVSTNSMASDGWIYVSTFIANGSDPDPSQQWTPYQGELLRIKWDGSVIERLAHNRTKKLNYWNQPRASISTSGRYLFWSSNYRRNHAPSAGDKYADVYMIDFGSSGPGSGSIAPPSNLQASGFPDPRIDLTWTDNASNDDAVEVLRQGPNDPAFHLLSFLGANATSFQDSSVVAGQRYCYRVVAHAGNLSSQPSNIACATPTAAPTPPAAPTSLSAADTTATSVDLGWKDNASNEDMFDVRRRGPGDPSFSSIATLNANSTSYKDAAVVAGQQFCYEVMAKNGAGGSAPSNAACATPTSAPPPVPKPEPPGEEPPPEPKPEPKPKPAPLAPSSVEVELVSSNRVRVTWSDDSDNETAFDVLRQVNGKKFRRVARLGADSVAFTDNRVWRRGKYCYVVSARNDAGVATSNEACITTGR